MVSENLLARDFLILKIIQGDGNMTDVARISRVTAGAATDRVESLCRRKLASKERVKDDQRKIALSLTAAGKRLIAKIEGAVNRAS
jgi:DNA-binding MarR family transcriptional regulator